MLCFPSFCEFLVWTDIEICCLPTTQTGQLLANYTSYQEYAIFKINEPKEIREKQSLHVTPTRVGGNSSKPLGGTTYN